MVKNINELIEQVERRFTTLQILEICALKKLEDELKYIPEIERTHKIIKYVNKKIENIVFIDILESYIIMKNYIPKELSKMIYCFIKKYGFINKGKEFEKYIINNFKYLFEGCTLISTQNYGTDAIIEFNNDKYIIEIKLTSSNTSEQLEKYKKKTGIKNTISINGTCENNISLELFDSINILLNTNKYIEKYNDDIFEYCNNIPLSGICVDKNNKFNNNKMGIIENENRNIEYLKRELKDNNYLKVIDDCIYNEVNDAVYITDQIYIDEFKKIILIKENDLIIVLNENNGNIYYTKRKL